MQLLLVGVSLRMAAGRALLLAAILLLPALLAAVLLWQAAIEPRIDVDIIDAQALIVEILPERCQRVLNDRAYLSVIAVERSPRHRHLRPPSASNRPDAPDAGGLPSAYPGRAESGGPG